MSPGKKPAEAGFLCLPGNPGISKSYGAASNKAVS
jgi:hypothetical protein